MLARDLQNVLGTSLSVLSQHSVSIIVLTLLRTQNGITHTTHAVACGEYISVSSQRDTEEADVEKEREEQRKGPAAQAHELEELTQIYVNR